MLTLLTKAKEMELNGRSIAGVPCENLRLLRNLCFGSNYQHVAKNVQVIASGKVSTCKVRDALHNIHQLSESDDAGSGQPPIEQATQAIGNLG